MGGFYDEVRQEIEAKAQELSDANMAQQLRDEAEEKQKSEDDVKVKTYAWLQHMYKPGMTCWWVPNARQIRFIACSPSPEHQDRFGVFS